MSTLGVERGSVDGVARTLKDAAATVEANRPVELASVAAAMPGAEAGGAFSDLAVVADDELSGWSSRVSHLATQMERAVGGVAEMDERIAHAAELQRRAL